MQRALFTQSRLVAIATAMPVVLAAQTRRAEQFVDNCNSGSRDRAQYCETRAVAIANTSTIRVDGRQNGGITVHGWDNGGVQVVAMIQAQANSQGAAQSIARQINVTSSNGEIRADGPDAGDDESWSVSYEVYAPRHTNLSLVAHNGGLSIDGMDSQMELTTTNGGVSLSDVAGGVRARTQNGGITASLSGDRWRGQGLDAETTNGGVHLTIPAAYAARLETSTVNGRLDLGVPVTVQGRLSRQLSADINGGGPTIRMVTTNGGVSVSRR